MSDNDERGIIRYDEDIEDYVFNKYINPPSAAMIEFMRVISTFTISADEAARALVEFSAAFHDELNNLLNSDESADDERE